MTDFIRLDADDNVVTATRSLPAGHPRAFTGLVKAGTIPDEALTGGFRATPCHLPDRAPLRIC